MNSPMDMITMQQASSVPANGPMDINSLIQQARQNPQAFEDYIKRVNPQGYQQALQIRNSPNPQAIIRQMAQSRGINPNIFQMLGIK